MSRRDKAYHVGCRTNWSARVVATTEHCANVVFNRDCEISDYADIKAFESAV